jgi:hypothetical protein
MTIAVRSVCAVLSVSAAVLLMAACTRSSPSRQPSATEAPTTSPSSAASTSSAEDRARQAAVVAYEGYWSVSNEAGAETSVRDWKARLAEYAADPALSMRLDSIANYRSVPAHFVGTPRRSPRVAAVSLERPARVSIEDCIDVSDWKLVSDKPGELGRNLNDSRQPQRYRFFAEVVEYETPTRWLVQQVRPDVNQTC